MLKSEILLRSVILLQSEILLSSVILLKSEIYADRQAGEQILHIPFV